MQAELPAPHSRHFSVHPLTEGVFAAIATKGGSADCNAGIIDLGGMCLVFDSFLTPSAAEELCQTVKVLVGHGPDIVINSHYHNDHTWGNQAFAPPAHIVASRQTYELMLTEGKKEFEEETASAVETLAYCQNLVQKAETEERRSTAEMFLGIYEGLVQDLPRLAVRLPDITYEGRLSFHGANRSAELIAYSNCHTGNDAVLFLPEDGIVFMSDLLFVECHPYLSNGDPANLVKTLKEIWQLNVTRFVPGHGMVGGRAELDQNIDYIESCIETAQALVKEGRADKETISTMQVPERYKHWLAGTFYRSNLQFLCGRLTPA